MARRRAGRQGVGWEARRPWEGFPDLRPAAWERRARAPAARARVRLELQEPAQGARVEQEIRGREQVVLQRALGDRWREPGERVPPGPLRAELRARERAARVPVVGPEPLQVARDRVARVLEVQVPVARVRAEQALAARPERVAAPEAEGRRAAAA